MFFHMHYANNIITLIIQRMCARYSISLIFRILKVKIKSLMPTHIFEINQQNYNR